MITGESNFDAVAFHPGMGNETVAGRIVVTRWLFRFHSDAMTLEIPLERLHVRAGTGSDERLYFGDRTQPEWEIITDDFSVLDIPEIAAIDGIAERLSREASRQELRRRLRIVGYAAGACVVLVCLGQLALSFMVRSLVARLPPKVEQDLGNALIAELQEELVMVEDSNRVAQLTALAAPLTRNITNANLQFTYYLAEDDEPNACALPGGHVVVNTGLLKMAERPEHVIGVIAHEVAHVTQKHGIRKVIASAGPFLIFRVFLGGNDSGLVRVAGAASALMIQQGFSQEYEIEADDVGWESLLVAKINPTGMTEMFQKLRDHERAQRVSGLELPQAFQSHPALDKRIARLETKWSKARVKASFQDLTWLGNQLVSAAGEQRATTKPAAPKH